MIAFKSSGVALFYVSYWAIIYKVALGETVFAVLKCECGYSNDFSITSINEESFDFDLIEGNSLFRVYRSSR